MKQLTIYSWYTDRELITLPLTDRASKISYITHPNNETKTTLGSRDMTLAEIMRMPMPLLKTFLSTLSKAWLVRFETVVKNQYRAGKLDPSRYEKFISCVREAKVA